MTKILALAASFRTDSLNKQLLALASAEVKAASATVTTLTYEECDTPTYRDDDSPLPKGAKLFADALLAHDGLLLATPEYNWSIPGGLKNLIDWVSVDARNPFTNKTALLMCATPSARGGVTGLLQLRTPLEALGCWVHPQMISIGRAQEQLAGGTLARAKDQTNLNESVRAFVRATIALNHART